MNKKEFLALSLAFLFCFLAIGIPYWRTEYSSLSLPDSLFAVGLLLTAIAAMLLCLRGTGFLSTAAILGMTAPSVVAIRIFMDTLRDDSTHNLWPFEMAIAVFVGFFVAGFAGMLGVLLRRVFKPNSSRPPAE